MTISERILQVSKEKGITQKAIAETINVTPSTVNSWIKTNSENIPSSYVIPISKLLGLTPEELIEGKKPELVKKAPAQDFSILSENEKYLLAIFRNLDTDGQIVVLNAAILEKRSASSIQGKDGFETSKAEMGVG